MRKLFLAISTMLLITSCTENDRVKNWGGTGTINLPAGRKLLNITWKESEIWYLTTPMDSAYIPQTYQFHEESSFGITEGTYNIVESK